MGCLQNVFNHTQNLDTIPSRIPIWFMRQAGRYLPEYLKVRANFENFMEFVATPEAAAEVTLQPLRRFDLDAAIIFSDILVIPQALGQEVNFIKGHGPTLAPFPGPGGLNLKDITSRLRPTLDALKLVKDRLIAQKTNHDLIGFSGAPWTLACYMLEGKGSKSFDLARLYAASHQKLFYQLMDILVEAISTYLVAQAHSGATVLKLFDSWAGNCPHWLTERAIIRPLKEILKKVRLQCDVPIIYFPRGAGEKYLNFINALQPDGIALDQFVDIGTLANQYQYQCQSQEKDQAVVFQGGLDPMVLEAGGDLLEAEIIRHLDIFQKMPYIFNLGHGMVPSMPPSNVERAIEIVRMVEQQRREVR